LSKAGYLQSIEQVLASVRRQYLFVSGALYPAWVRSGQLDHAEVPVFYYHRVGAARFERLLNHLARNKYHTLTADEYHEMLRSTAAPSDVRAVMLTFDDGLAEVYGTVYPLLQRYAMKAVAYVVPGWIGSPGIVSWEQLKEMHASGVVDVQSHSMNHRAIYVGSQICDFFPGGLYRASRYLYPLETGLNGLPTYFDGMPLYRSASRLSDTRRWTPKGVAEQRCFDVIQRSPEGPSRLSTRRKKALWAEMHQAGLHQSSPGTEESFVAQRAAITQEVEESKRALEHALPGKVVRHFAYPWHEGGYLSARAICDAGFATCASGLQPHAAIAAQPGLAAVSRVSLDFLECLPGSGRRTFVSILADKFIRGRKAHGSFEQRET
jgi:hypothetical protein